MTTRIAVCVVTLAACEPNPVPTQVSIINSCAESRFVAGNDYPFQLAADGRQWTAGAGSTRLCSDCGGAHGDYSGLLIEVEPGGVLNLVWDGRLYAGETCHSGIPCREPTRVAAGAYEATVPYATEPPKDYSPCSIEFDPDDACNSYPELPLVGPYNGVVLWSYFRIGGFATLSTTDVVEVEIAGDGTPLEIEMCRPSDA